MRDGKHFSKEKNSTKHAAAESGNSSRASSIANIALPILIVFLVIALILVLKLRSARSGEPDAGPYAGRETVSLSGYYGIIDYYAEHTTDDGDTGTAKFESRFVDTDVAEILKLMRRKESFVFFATFEDCPYCNAIIPYLNEALMESGLYAGYLNTRKDPSWQSNLDIDDYDKFAEEFKRFLEKDENGILHLYTPDLYVVKSGRVVFHHQGVIEGADDPDKPLTSEQEKALRELLSEALGKLQA